MTIGIMIHHALSRRFALGQRMSCAAHPSDPGYLTCSFDKAKLPLQPYVKSRAHRAEMVPFYLLGVASVMGLLHR